MGKRRCSASKETMKKKKTCNSIVTSVVVLGILVILTPSAALQDVENKSSSLGVNSPARPLGGGGTQLFTIWMCDDSIKGKSLKGLRKSKQHILKPWNTTPLPRPLTRRRSWPYTTSPLVLLSVHTHYPANLSSRKDSSMVFS